MIETGDGNIDLLVHPEPAAIAPEEGSALATELPAVESEAAQSAVQDAGRIDECTIGKKRKISVIEKGYIF